MFSQSQDVSKRNHIRLSTAQWNRTEIASNPAQAVSESKRHRMPQTGSHVSRNSKVQMLQVPGARFNRWPRLALKVELLGYAGVRIFASSFGSGQSQVVVHCKSGLGRSMSLLAALAVAFCPGVQGYSRGTNCTQVRHVYGVEGRCRLLGT